MTYIRTFTGERFHPKGTGKINSVDIAHALGNLCRFGGHSKSFYSVAQHSVLVSHLVPRRLALAGLLHDATEAYLVDIPTPIKYLPELAGYRELERTIQERVEAAFKLERGLLSCQEVKEADRTALCHEAYHYLGVSWDDLKLWGAASAGLKRFLPKELPMDPQEAKSAFLHRLTEVS